MFSQKPQTHFLEWKSATEAGKELAEKCYAAYRDKTESAVWRLSDSGEAYKVTDKKGKQIITDKNIETIYKKNKVATANAWLNFAHHVQLDETSGSEETKKLFDSYFRPAAENTSYGGSQLPDFNHFLPIQKEGWDCAVKACCNLKDSPNPTL